MAPEKKKMGDKLWNKLLPRYESAGSHSQNALTEWAESAYITVTEALAPRADWRWLLADMRERCFDHKPKAIECPYTTTYLVQLAETWERAERNFDRGVPVSVLIEGRHLPNLLDVIEPGMTVGRMKAIVTKYTPKKDGSYDPRSIDEIEAEQKRHRLDGREKSKRKAYAEKIANWPLDNSDDLLPNATEETTAYQNALARFAAEGVAFEPGDIAVALHAAKGLVSMLEGLMPALAKAA